VELPVHFRRQLGFNGVELCSIVQVQACQEEPVRFLGVASFAKQAQVVLLIASAQAQRLDMVALELALLKLIGADAAASVLAIPD
jgi:hypothetical protein